MKKFYLSKTMVFNTLYALVAIAGLFGYNTFEPSVETLQVVAIAVAAVNLILRTVTNQAITV